MLNTGVRSILMALHWAAQISVTMKHSCLMSIYFYQQSPKSMSLTVSMGLFNLTSSRTILEKYLKQAVNLAEDHKTTDKLSKEKRNQMHFHLAHYSDALFRSHEERLCSNECKVALQLPELKEKEREALTKRYRSAGKKKKLTLH